MAATKQPRFNLNLYVVEYSNGKTIRVASPVDWTMAMVVAWAEKNLRTTDPTMQPAMLSVKIDGSAVNVDPEDRP
jgi:hypothetical protein